MIFNYEPDSELARAKYGDIVKHNGQRFRVTKKTNYAIAVEPWPWYAELEQRFLRFLWRILP